MMVDMTQVDTGLGVASVAGSVIGGTVGEAVTAGATAAEAIIDAVGTAQANHASAFATASSAVSALQTAAVPILTTLPAADAEKAATGINLIQTILADLKSFFAL